MPVGKVSYECGIYIPMVIYGIVGTEQHSCGHVYSCGLAGSICGETLAHYIISEISVVAYVVFQSGAGEVAIAGNFSILVVITVVQYRADIYY